MRELGDGRDCCRVRRVRALVKHTQEAFRLHWLRHAVWPAREVLVAAAAAAGGMWTGFNPRCHDASLPYLAWAREDLL